MPKTLQELLIFGLSSLVIYLLNYFKAPVSAMQQLVAFTLILLILSFSKFKQPWFRLFISSLLVQLIVTSSGNLYSPMLILLYIFTIGLSFFISLRSGMIFLLFGLVTLILNTFITQSALFHQDPGTAILYLVAFLTVIPMAAYAAKNYQLKDTLSKFLQKQLNLEHSLVGAVDELIFVTDINLRIVSINKAAENLLHGSNADFIHLPLLNVANLKDEQGLPITRDFLSIDNLLADKTIREIRGSFLYPPNSSAPFQVLIKIKPIINAQSIVDQLIFVMTTTDIGEKSHANLVAAKQRYDDLSKQFQTMLSAAPAQIKLQEELIHKIGQDLDLMKEIEDHQFKISSDLVDIIEVTRLVYANLQTFAQVLGVALTLNQDPAITQLIVPIDKKWLSVLMEELTSLMLLLASKDHLTVTITTIKQKNAVIALSAPFRKLTMTEQKEIFTAYYGSLRVNTNLQLGSGLEGFLAKTIADALGIRIQIVEKQSDLIFLLEFKA